MPKFRKKPEVPEIIEAIQIKQPMVVDGTIELKPGDWIIYDPKGPHFCRDAVFKERYEPVVEDDSSIHEEVFGANGVFDKVFGKGGTFEKAFGSKK